MILLAPAASRADAFCGDGGANPWTSLAPDLWRGGALQKGVTLHVGEWSRAVVSGIGATVVVVRPPPGVGAAKPAGAAAPSTPRPAIPAKPLPQPKIIYAPGVRPPTPAVQQPVSTVGGADPRTAPLPIGTDAPPGMLALPIAGVPVTSGFGWRIHPILGYRKFHYGVDFGAPRGTPVRAAASGTVEACGREAAEGTFVQLRHDRRTVTLYAHLDRFAAMLRQGQVVQAGEVIAYVGSSGLSTGPHLYYEVRIDGRAVDPIGFPARAPADDPAGNLRSLLVQAP